MVKAVLFDFDDTLVTTQLTKIQAIQQTAKSIYNIDLPEQTVKQYWGMPYREFIKVLFAEANDELDTIITHYERIRENFPASLYDDVLETMDMLLPKVNVGIVSSASKTVVMKDMRLLGLPYEKFFFIQTEEDTIVHKPHPEVFTPILNKLTSLGITKKEVLYVGDSLGDFFAARDAGIPFYGLANRTVLQDEFTKHQVNVIYTVKDVALLLRG